MNSEELELSLRTEFESYLKDVLAGIRQDVSEFQKNFEAEFEKHKSQTDEAFRNLFKRFESGTQFDQSFTESVVEHLRLARDDGATITAAAFGEAEKLKESTAPAAEFDKLRDAINDISSKTSQSEILNSLVEAASNFTPRGAFFIVKNDHFVGWRVFGKEAAADEVTVRGTQFPTSSDTVLTDAITSLATVMASRGNHSDDQLFLERLEFGAPDRMYAIPLTARGRGVAVLYADYGSEGVNVNAEALETLVRVAGLTVELIASAQPAPVQRDYVEPSTVSQPAPAVVEETAGYADESPVVEAESEYEETGPAFEEVGEVAEIVEPEAVSEPEEPTISDESEAVEEYTGAVSFEETEAEETVAEETPAFPEVERFADEYPAVAKAPVQFETAEVEEVTYFEPVEEIEVTETEFTESEPDFESADPFSTVAEEPEVEVVEEPTADFVSRPDASYGNGNVAHVVTEPLAQVATAQAERTRYRDRNVDLPIEVAGDERRLHNDARRFARLLVSEIKLYNEQKVNEGRDTGDLYDRLREAIDRSRDMYDKRVQDPVAAKFDYFHYELVNSLADGEDVKLGASYPGAKVLA
ncbi:MAG: hypothetical protein ABIU09_03125 [Pyrinomonadaceae bacterium]